MILGTILLIQWPFFRYVINPILLECLSRPHGNCIAGARNGPRNRKEGSPQWKTTAMLGASSKITHIGCSALVPEYDSTNEQNNINLALITSQNILFYRIYLWDFAKKCSNPVFSQIFLQLVHPFVNFLEN